MARRPKRPPEREANAEMAARLDALYAELPKLNCQGKCWKCCGRVLMAPGERRRIEREHGVEIPTVPEMRSEKRELCPALKDHRCTVYTARPLMCRLWGIEEGMRCPYGCVPEGGWMREAEAVGFWLKAYAIAGWPAEKEEQITRQEVVRRLRAWERNWAGLPESERTRILPDDDGRKRPRLPWRRSK